MLSLPAKPQALWTQSPMHGHRSITADFAPSEASVRATLRKIMRKLQDHGINADDRGTCEIVLAEAMNNIVEHACVPAEGQCISVCVQTAQDHVHFVLRDTGKAMPNHHLPRPQDYSLTGSCADLPEGGFGWNLIHILTNDLRYDRQHGVNRLQFSLPISR